MKSFERIIAGHRIRATAQEAQAALVEDIFTLIGQQARHAPLKAGLRLRFGWTMFTLQEDGDVLIVCEPDFGHDPHGGIRPRIDLSLDIMAKQASFARSQGIEPLDVRFDQSLIAGRGALAGPGIQALRVAPDGDDDSGWSVTEAGAENSSDNPDDFEVVEIHELLGLRPALLPMLILPTGYGVILEKGMPPLILPPG